MMKLLKLQNPGKREGAAMKRMEKYANYLQNAILLYPISPQY